MEPYLVEHYRVVGSTDTGFQFLERKNSLPMPEVLPVRSAANIQ